MNKFMMYFNKGEVCYPQMNERDLKDARDRIEKKYIGIEDFLDKFLYRLDIFKSAVFALPKGMLFFGPPGTGKSAITKEFCEQSGFMFVAPPMAAGDLKKGIVGDSQRTLNEIASRAHLVPWDLVFALIDEIDSLVPARGEGGSSNTGDNDLISVILAIMDGSKVTRNLKIIASTNLLSKMDAAFLRRMEIQLFLGNPSRSSRIKWIQRKFDEV